MCSKRCAKPVRPTFSFFDPTWNHSFTCTIGSLRSMCRITCSPFGSVNFSKASFGVSAFAEAAALTTALAVLAGAGGVAGAGVLAGAGVFAGAGAGAGAWAPSDIALRQTRLTSKAARDAGRDAAGDTEGRDARDAITEVLLWCSGGEIVVAAPLYPKPIDRAPGCDERDELAVGRRAAARHRLVLVGRGRLAERAG